MVVTGGNSFPFSTKFPQACPEHLLLLIFDMVSASLKFKIQSRRRPIWSSADVNDESAQLLTGTLLQSNSVAFSRRGRVVDAPPVTCRYLDVKTGSPKGSTSFVTSFSTSRPNGCMSSSENNVDTRTRLSPIARREGRHGLACRPGRVTTISRTYPGANFR